jgi:hypothetical protein
MFGTDWIKQELKKALYQPFSLALIGLPARGRFQAPND